MNVGDTKPYNADFDGDEMNMHMPQNVLAETELRQLARFLTKLLVQQVIHQLLVFIKILFGSYRLTRDNIKFTPREAMNLLMMFQM